MRADAHEGRLARHRPGRGEPALSKVALVVPTFALLGEHARQAFVVQIDELIARSVRPRGKQSQLGVGDGPDLFVPFLDSVLELDRRHAPDGVRAVRLLDVSVLGERRQEREVRRARISVREVERLHQGRTAGQLGEVMEQQDSLAEPRRPDLESGLVLRERVPPRVPRLGSGVRGVRGVLAVIEHGLENVIGLGRRRVAEGLVRRAVTVQHTFQVQVGVGNGTADHAVPVVQQRGVDARFVFSAVDVVSAVAPVVEDQFRQPLEDPAPVAGIGDPRCGAPAEQRGLIVLRDHAPSALAGGLVAPPLDAREGASMRSRYGVMVNRPQAESCAATT